MTKKSPNRVIKRYPNRKLYDTEQSRYIKLKEVARLVREGVEVQIVDNQSGEDITGPTLAKLLGTGDHLGNEKIPVKTLRHLVQSGGELLNRKSLNDNDPQGRRADGASFREDVERGFAKLVSRELDAADSWFQPVREWMDGIQERMDEAHQQADDKIAEIRATLPVVLANRAALDALEARVSELEKQVSAQVDTKDKTHNSQIYRHLWLPIPNTTRLWW